MCGATNHMQSKHEANMRPLSSAMDCQVPQGLDGGNNQNEQGTKTRMQTLAERKVPSKIPRRPFFHHCLALLGKGKMCGSDSRYVHG